MDESEDSHLCLRCKASIIGLDKYVEHRQAGCVPSVPPHVIKQRPQQPSTTTTTPTQPPPTPQPTTTTTDKHEGSYQNKTEESSQHQVVQYPSIDHHQQHHHHQHHHHEKEETRHVENHHHQTTLSHHHHHHHHLSSSHQSDKYPPPSPSVAASLGVCYDHQAKQDPPAVTRTDMGSLHDSYTVIEDFPSTLPHPPHSDPSISTTSHHHSGLKSKSSGLSTISHKDTQAQAPFTGYTDPLLPHGQDSANMTLFRQFDTFSDHNKMSHEGETETQGEAMGLFKVSSLSYDLESKNFESRYSDFYSLQHSSQEPLLTTTVQTLEQHKDKQERQESIKIPNALIEENMKEKETDTEKGTSEDIREGVKQEYRETGDKFSESSKFETQKPDLRQDDFLSSLELRSSVKAGAKRRHDDEDEFDDDDDDETRPPRHHTGGKWRPGSRPPPTTGGKWRPATPKVDLEVEEDIMDEDEGEEEEESLVPPPPPTYTKGKWLPGKKMTNITKVGSIVEYHCHACSRTLKGKEAYERHLNSELHFVNENKASGRRKTRTPKVVPAQVISTRPVRSKKLAAQSFLKATIAHLKSRKITPSETRPSKKESTAQPNTSTNTSTTAKGVLASLMDCKKRYIKKEIKVESGIDEDEDDDDIKKTVLATPKLLCPICKLSFGEAYAALHFASLAHIHNELEYRESRSQDIDSTFNKLIVQNFSAIVKTSPFMCNVCKFYCNLQDDFLTHMKTHKDDPDDTEIKTLFRCSACTDEDDMQLSGLLRHLQTPHHFYNARDNVMQTRQVVITSRTAVVCPMGDGVFRYMIQYRAHRRLHHQEHGFQLNEQRLLKCPQCSFKALREYQIRAHIKQTHPDSKSKTDKYHCFVCGLAFPTHDQAVNHRRSADHRTTLERQKGISVSRTCRMCYIEAEDLAALRRHMCENHRKDCTPCHQCGVVLPLRCDLAQHQRLCTREPGGDMKGDHKCDLCTFKNDLLAHVLMHKTLSHGQRDVDGRYNCHICKTKLRISSVKGHMLSHTNEWPHACHLCSRKFPQQEWRDSHLQAVHAPNEASQHTDGPSLCDTCGKTLSNRWHLYRHQQETHTRPSSSSSSSTKTDSRKTTPSSSSTSTSSSTRKPREWSRRGPYAKRNVYDPPTPQVRPLCDVCGVQCESHSLLKLHRQDHKRGEGDKYVCPHCNYTTLHHPHLRRHLRLHTGSTPFSCPYCPYVCNNQENLRKHMLKTMRHPGRFMYECRLCQTPEGGTEHLPGTPSTATQEAVKLESPALSSTNENSLQSRQSQPHPQTLNLDPSQQPRVYDETSSPDDNPNLTRGKEESPEDKATLILEDLKQLEQQHVFKSNYATEFQVHLLQEHRDAFPTKNEVKAHIRSYYRQEEDATFTTAPLPFVHKKRKRPASVSRPTDHDEVDDPGSEGTEEAQEEEQEQGEEDVLSQLSKSLDMNVCCGSVGEGTVTGGVQVQQHNTTSNKEMKTTKTAAATTTGGNELAAAAEATAAAAAALRAVATAAAATAASGDTRREVPQASTSLLHPGRRGSQEGVVKLGSGGGTGGGGGAVVVGGGASPRSYSRAPPPAPRPSILKQGQQQARPVKPQTIKFMIQQLPGGEEEDGTRQVVLILPDDYVEDPGDLEALLPSLGITTSPTDCVSIAPVQPRDIPHHFTHTRAVPSQQSQIHRGQPEGNDDSGGAAVVVQTDQVITLDSQVVADTQVLPGPSVESGQQQGQVMLYPQTQHLQTLRPQMHNETSILSHKQHLLQGTTLLSPLQVVAKAAEVLTQCEELPHEVHHVLPQPPIIHEVLGHPEVGSEVVLGHSSCTQTSNTPTSAHILGPDHHTILTEPSATSTQLPQILKTNILELGSGGQQDMTGQVATVSVPASTAAATTHSMQQGSSLQLVNEQHMSSGGQAKSTPDGGNPGEIMYSFTLQ